MKNSFDHLMAYKQFIEVKGFKLHWWESYLKTRYYLKNLVLGQDRVWNEAEISAVYEWLVVCINPTRDPNYDFFFDKKVIAAIVDQEDEVEKMLFDTKTGRLRDVFKNTEWQIRLRRVMGWFLKRYNVGTSRKIYEGLDPRAWLERIDLLLPRLIGSIFIGFLPLITVKDFWEIPLELGWVWALLLSVLTFVPSYVYFKREFFKATSSTGNSRPARIFLRGVIYSLVTSLLLTVLFSKHFIGERFSVSYCYSPYLGHALRFYPQIWIFFASSALLIGILIQIFWEEKTVTEPL